MAGWGSCDFERLQRMRDKIKKYADIDAGKLTESTVKELANRLLRKVKLRTPVDFGTLRQNWMVGHVYRIGKTYIVEVYNAISYGPYVEYGHRTRGHDGWVHGVFMMTISAQQLQRNAPKIIEKKITKFLKEVLNDN